MTNHPEYTDEQLTQAVAAGKLRGYTASNWFGVTAFHGQRDESRPHNFPAVRRVYDVTLDNNGGKPFRTEVDTVQIIAPQWRVVASRYEGPCYAIVDEHDKVARDLLDGRLCVFTTRATAEYQLSYLRSRDRMAVA